MSVSEQIIKSLPGLVDAIVVTKSAELHGQKATEVVVNLVNGKQVSGTFTTEAKPGFGGVEFDSKKDIAGLMVSKIKSVLEGKAE